ncbi:hypothetical protein GLOIN_2v1782239 [Rhizophagus clarus]|uniref:Uncharacterized protein n=1 Tax=Rhizophagus clarus TaxID=94130 RepID=A0A8H3MAC6_9GLOM|nr:hypothetical protein GLOIN_2v1782239 [Rhizophagus clarus]
MIYIFVITLVNYIDSRYPLDLGRKRPFTEEAQNTREENEILMGPFWTFSMIIFTFITLELIDTSSVKEFWSSIGIYLARDAHHHIKNNSEFAVLLEADYDYNILESADDIKLSFMMTIRGIKITRDDLAIWFINVIGSSNILRLKSKDGHAGLVCLCRKAIQNKLMKKIKKINKDFKFELSS